MKEKTKTIIAMLDELLTISKNQRTSQSSSANMDITSIKTLIEDRNRQNREYSEAKLTKFAEAIINNLNTTNDRTSKVTQSKQPNFENIRRILEQTAQNIDEINARHKINETRHSFALETKWNWAVLIRIIPFVGSSISILYFVSRPNYDRIDNDLKSSYINMKSEASHEQITELENILGPDRDNKKIGQMRK